MLPSNLNLNIGKAAGYNNKFLRSNIDKKIDLNRNVNKVFHQKSWSLAAPPKLHAVPEIYLIKT